MYSSDHRRPSYPPAHRQQWDEHEYGRERKWEEKLQRISSGRLKFLSSLFGSNKLWHASLFLVDAMTELKEHELDEYGRERKLDEILQRITLRCLRFSKLFFSINTAWFVLLFLVNIIAPDNGKLSSDEALEVFLAGATFAGITCFLSFLERRYVNEGCWEEIDKAFKPSIAFISLSVSACTAVFIWIYLYFYLCVLVVFLVLFIMLAGFVGGGEAVAYCFFIF